MTCLSTMAFLLCQPTLVWELRWTWKRCIDIVLEKKMDKAFLPDWLSHCAENRPGHLAVQCDQVQWSFVELDRQTVRLARQLAALGIQVGSRVALLAANGLPY